MKILYFYITNSFEGFLSFNVHIRELLRNMNKLKGVDLIGYRPVVQESSPQADYLSFYGKFKEKVPRWCKDILALLSNIPELRHSMKRIREEKPDGLLFRYNFMNFYQLILQRISGLPLILEVNSPLSDERKKDGTLLFYRLAFALEKLAWRKADKIHVVSAELKKILTKYVPEEKIFVAHNGVNPEEYDNLTRSDNERVRIGFVGSFGLYHGIDVLFEVIPKILDKFSNVEFMLIGKGGVHEEYCQWFKNSPYADRVHLPGYVDRDNIPQELVNFDIATMLDFTEYGSPLKMFEYMAAGCAMVLPDRKTIREVISEGEDGVFFTARDAAAFEDTITKLVENSDFRMKLGQNAKTKVGEKYTWLNNAKIIADEMRNLIETK